MPFLHDCVLKQKQKRCLFVGMQLLLLNMVLKLASDTSTTHFYFSGCPKFSVYFLKLQSHRFPSCWPWLPPTRCYCMFESIFAISSNKGVNSVPLAAAKRTVKIMAVWVASPTQKYTSPLSKQNDIRCPGKALNIKTQSKASYDSQHSCQKPQDTNMPSAVLDICCKNTVGG